ncbi:penicillin-binding protein 2B [Pelagirhabdus alkalitolerans]|uniref:serine-type D-Ala-D-Ala carboxypeptidase n=1 Tax=Pelagirhabdus alkalitolerans TaxID=1612202 RepID=A0A1G6GZP4_9BACI|nr:penicillin-binding transpeptidase domain-containing protein [Pelagirhabdus alkalitolerans]SDB87517.1 penicillin-binding protein 2B [Pelagirhabdus alkalitolerans]
MNKPNAKFFINLFFGMFFVLFLVIAGRLIFISATGEVQGVNLEDWANKQRTTETSLPAQRGYIYDRNGMTLAQDLTTYGLYAVIDESYSPNPERRLNHVDDVDRTAEGLADVLDADASEIQDRLESGKENGQFQVEFGRAGHQLTREQYLAIEELELPGIYFHEGSDRYYPNGLFASQVIGLAQANDGGQVTGLTGIEAQLEDVLRGEDGSLKFERDNYHSRLLDANEVIEEEQDGHNVTLTIDQKIQTVLEDAMTQVDAQYEPERITATVMDPKTGEVLAMSNRPSYNPNQLENVTNWYNDVVSTPIEPGSTMKAFTIAAAIEEGVYDPDETYESGSYSIDQIDRPITDYRRHWGEITFEEGFQRSSNVAMSKLVWEKLGTETFHDYLEAFHFDRPTGIDLPREEAGTILYRYPIEQLTTSYGQGTTVTPIQMLKAATAIANDGKMVQPYVIQDIVNPDTQETIQSNEPEVVDQPISKETADEVLKAMESVVSSDVGTARNIYDLESYTVAGKTGTAQISSSEGGYLEGHENYIFSFLGMAPADDPELLMYVTVQQPKIAEDEAGSAPVSFIFNHVMENALHYMNIKPDKESEETVGQIHFPDWHDQSVDTVVDRLNEANIDPVVIGEGDTIVNSNMDADELILSTDKVMLVTDEPTMPDLSGWSLRSVTEFAHLLDLDIEMIGSGYLIEQSIEEGASIENSPYLLTEFLSYEQLQEQLKAETEEESDEVEEEDQELD